MYLTLFEDAEFDYKIELVMYHDKFLKITKEKWKNMANKAINMRKSTWCFSFSSIMALSVTFLVHQFSQFFIILRLLFRHEMYWYVKNNFKIGFTPLVLGWKRLFTKISKYMCQLWNRTNLLFAITPSPLKLWYAKSDFNVETSFFKLFGIHIFQLIAAKKCESQH